MPDKDEIELIIDPGGNIRHLVDVPEEAVAGLGEAVEVWRNSHVEPGSELRNAALTWLDVTYAGESEWDAYNGPQSRFTQSSLDCKSAELKSQYLTKWWADMLPVGGPVLGPYTHRKAALEAEITWLRANNLPLPLTKRVTPSE